MTPFDPITAARNARFIQFAYNMYWSAPNALEPPADPGINVAGYEIIYFLNAHDFQDVKFYGYLAASQTDPGDLILAIRGIQTLQEWVLDFDAIPLPYLGKGFVVGGFRAIAETFQMTDANGVGVGKLTAALTARNAVAPITMVTVLGHSLGGALATLAAAQLAFANPTFGADIVLWTYASPTIGFLDFTDAFNQAVPNTYRVWNSLDIVPQVPPFPYLHVGQSEEIKQTQAQIQMLSVNPSCEHHLSSYEWLLDSAEFSLDADCREQAPASAAVVAVAATVTERSAGAAAMAQGLQSQ